MILRAFFLNSFKETLGNSLSRRFANISSRLNDSQIERYVFERKRDQEPFQDERKSGEDSRNGVFQRLLKVLKMALLCPSVCLATTWAQDRLAEMTLEEKIGQLLMAPAAPLHPDSQQHWADWQRLMKECHLGNAIIKASDPATQIAFLDKLQSQSKIPLLVSADAEWGLGMRMSETISFPRNLTLGAVQDLSLIEEMGRHIARQAKKVGIHLNLAPVADVNCNPLNPRIHMRSFGEDPIEVAKRCRAIIRGMRKEGLLTCAKHFPGHGDTAIDSHFSLPQLDQNKERLEAVEFVPFEAAIKENVDCIMSGHLLAPHLDPYPASLSSYWMKGVLCDQLGFDGLMITDALNMRALTNAWSVEDIALRAFEAGHHLLLYGDHIIENVDEIMQKQIPAAFHALHEAFLNHRFSIQDLDERVLKILQIKERCCLSAPTNTESLFDLDALALKKTLFREALTLIGTLPKMDSFVYVAIGGSKDDWIVQKLQEEGIEVICIDLQEQQIPVIDKPYMVGVHQAKSIQEQFGLGSEARKLIEQSHLAIYFCTPYLLQLVHAPATLVAYENDPDAQTAAYEALKGQFVPHGRLPVLRYLNFN